MRSSRLTLLPAPLTDASHAALRPRWSYRTVLPNCGIGWWWWWWWWIWSWKRWPRSPIPCQLHPCQVLPLWRAEPLFEVLDLALLPPVLSPLMWTFAHRDCMAPPGTAVEGQHIVSNTANGNTRSKTCYKCHLEGHVSYYDVLTTADPALCRLHVNVLN